MQSVHGKALQMPFKITHGEGHWPKGSKAGGSSTGIRVALCAHQCMKALLALRKLIGCTPMELDEDRSHGEEPGWS
jgi:hypothetical protein